MEHITEDEYKILKTFMKHPNTPLSQSELLNLYPKDSEIRISFVHLCDDKCIDTSRTNNDEIVFLISRKGRISYKVYKDFLKQKLKDLIIDKSIDFCALIISLIALIVSVIALFG